MISIMSLNALQAFRKNNSEYINTDSKSTVTSRTVSCLAHTQITAVRCAKLQGSVIRGMRRDQTGISENVEF